MTNKARGILSLCRKAGKLKMGFEPVKETLWQQEARLILYTNDLSEKTRESMNWQIRQADHPPPCRVLSASMEELSAICGKRTGILAITDQGLAEAIEKLLNQSEEEAN